MALKNKFHLIIKISESLLYSRYGMLIKQMIEETLNSKYKLEVVIDQHIKDSNIIRINRGVNYEHDDNLEIINLDDYESNRENQMIGHLCFLDTEILTNDLQYDNLIIHGNQFSQNFNLNIPLSLTNVIKDSVDTRIVAIFCGLRDAMAYPENSFSQQVNSGKFISPRQLDRLTSALLIRYNIDVVEFGNELDAV